MPYENIEQLPEDVKNQLPQGAKNIFLTAFNSASSDGVSEAGANEVAWNSVKCEYEQRENGEWRHKKEAAASSNPLGNMPGA
ncbi:MAG: ChaB family protein [Microcoleaceae cyanobacterium]